MGKGWIDKKSAQHFTLVHRPQNDPRIHDESAPSMVLNPVPQRGSSSKAKRLDDLASELGSDAASIRANEGEAAEYGVYFDDTEYDYMQHLRDLNAGGGEAVWVEAEPASNKGKGKQTRSLDDALREMNLRDKSRSLFDEDVLPSQNLPKLNYQSQQDVPDDIAGLQPDMDPRLREVLEALEDDAYVDEDEDIFKELAKDNREIPRSTFEDQFYDEDEDGWESDDTAKPTREYNNDDVPQLVGVEGEATKEHQNENWMDDFKQFKKDQKHGGHARGAVDPSDIQSSMWTTTTMGGRRKKRKGALTNPSAYSMTSSSMVRTEQLTFLDSRFEKIDEEYASEMGADETGSVSAVSAMSSVQGTTRGDFDNILDDFLGNYTRPGKRTSKKTRPQTGLEQLDEIRKGLGPARLRTKGKT
ncbi:hypothetical protein ACRALDRAFT_1073524 [Sodiomyces alcalophilus JCM 7366]|uniref:uncharacterized protein n=1 Tax=Sodiomyces alcalophilus JCM 7366 TaxID=591952 RepID=UPI0039B6BF15